MEPVRRDWCEEHNRGDLTATDGLCPECEERHRARNVCRSLAMRGDVAYDDSLPGVVTLIGQDRAIDLYPDVIAAAIDEARRAERERCAKIADAVALRAADSAQVILANAAEEARNAISYEAKQGIARQLKGKQSFLHGKRHSAVEIAAAIRDIADNAL